MEKYLRLYLYTAACILTQAKRARMLSGDAELRVVRQCEVDCLAGGLLYNIFGATTFLVSAGMNLYL
jgi:hypothetical protein